MAAPSGAGWPRPPATLLIIAEPDGTFYGKDIIKLLAFCDDVPVVFGTRTAREFVWEGANMGIFLKWGNYAVGKLVEFLFNTTFLSDVGCSMKLIPPARYTNRSAPISPSAGRPSVRSSCCSSSCTNSPLSRFR